MGDKTSNLNTGKVWSVSDLVDLRWSVTYGRSLEDTADFLCRSVEEVWSKTKELGLEFA